MTKMGKLLTNRFFILLSIFLFPYLTGGAVYGFNNTVRADYPYRLVLWIMGALFLDLGFSVIMLLSWLFTGKQIG